MTPVSADKYRVSAVVAFEGGGPADFTAVESLLDQRLYHEGELEIIGVEGPSDAGTLTRLSGHRHTVFIKTPEKENRTAAWNRGIHQARGRYVMILEAGDRVDADGVGKMVRIADDHRAAAAVWNPVDRSSPTDGQGRSGIGPAGPDCFELLAPNWFHQPPDWRGFLVRRSILGSSGYFHEGLQWFGLYELVFRLAEGGFKLIQAPGVTEVQRRSVSGTFFSDGANAKREYRQIIDNYLLPWHFIRFFGLEHVPDDKRLAQLLARTGALALPVARMDPHGIHRLYAAAKLFERALATDESNVTALNDLGVICSLMGDAKEGAGWINRAMQADDGRHQEILSANLEAAGRSESSAAAYRWIPAEDVAVMPDLPAGNRIDGGELQEKINAEAASGYYERILQIDPRHEEAARKPENLRFDLGSQKDETPPSAESLYQQARSLMSAQKWPEAAGLLEKCFALQPNHAEACNDLGAVHFQTGDIQAAAQYYEQAVRLCPQEPLYLKNLADLYFVKMQKVPEALEMYVRALELNPTDVETLINLGRMCSQLERKADAITFYNRVMELEPWNTEAGRELNELTRYREAG